MTTKYYKATYVNMDGTREDEVYISNSLDHAREYALTLETDGRKLDRVGEYDSLYDALTKD